MDPVWRSKVPADAAFWSCRQLSYQPGHALASQAPAEGWSGTNQHSPAGKIGATQIAQLFEHLGHPLTYEKLVEIMAQYDVDHSGQIEFGEFLRMFRNQLLDLSEVGS